MSISGRDGSVLKRTHYSSQNLDDMWLSVSVVPVSSLHSSGFHGYCIPGGYSHIYRQKQPVHII